MTGSLSHAHKHAHDAALADEARDLAAEAVPVHQGHDAEGELREVLPQQLAVHELEVDVPGHGPLGFGFLNGWVVRFGLVTGFLVWLYDDAI